MNKSIEQQKTNLEYWLLSSFQYIPIETALDKKQLHHCIDMAKGSCTKEARIIHLIDLTEKSKALRLEIENKLAEQAAMQQQQEMLAAIIGDEVNQ